MGHHHGTWLQLQLLAAPEFPLDPGGSQGSAGFILEGVRKIDNGASGALRNAPILARTGSIGRKEVRGRVGGGGVPVEVETGSGDIQIR